ncbi:uncharacterized protein LOC107640868 [Arachis ipaensis]|uniref:uncharacterized protein LOC107640868 n=1 Tax=Arachis ipaensis TaxID=130454 RepID=UPI0007AFDCEF|nr:uncharacterized protein LOC107640868 [Arachis ipaensis]
MAATMQATATALGDHPGNRNGGNGGNGPMTLATFMKINPLVFRGTTNRTEADNWFKAMEQALQVQQVLAEHVWSLPLTRWWVKLSIGSWKPDAYYIKTAKELELLQLKQDSMSVSEYTSQFEELCRFSRIFQGA